MTPTATETITQEAPPVGPTVRVESPFPDHAVPRLFLWTREFERAVADDYSPRTLVEFVDWWEAGMDRRKTWGVYRDDELGGLIVAETLNPATAAAHCIFAKHFWGEQTTVPALQMAFGELFESGVSRIMGTPFAHNSNMIALAKKIGFQREGTLRSHTMQGGKPVDAVVMGLLKEDFEKCRS